MLQAKRFKYSTLEDVFKPLVNPFLNTIYIENSIFAAHELSKQIVLFLLLLIPLMSPGIRAKDASQCINLALVQPKRISRSISVKAGKGKEIPTVECFRVGNGFHRVPIDLHPVRIQEYDTPHSFSVPVKSLADALNNFVSVSFSNMSPPAGMVRYRLLECHNLLGIVFYEEEMMKRWAGFQSYLS